ncbi:MAG: aspartate aminotransferase family protein [Chloroflexi bacterium]|nr:aspartate aminotransferase family protein [Chloroflexota bacterium]
MSTILERYRQHHPGSAARYQKALEVFPDGVTHDTRYVTPFPIYATHGQGARKWDVDGNEYVDYVMGHGALLMGHAHPAIVEAVAAQVARGTHLGASHDLELQWAGWVKRLIPSAEKVRFTSSGTEATMMALRLARAYTGRTKVVKFREHFHGWNDYLLAGSGRGAGGIPAAAWETMLVLEPNNIAIVEQTLAKDKDIAAIILEPTGAHMGTLPVHPSFLTELREVTRRHEVLLIFDEVVTGFRIAPGGAQARYGVTPDLTTLAKILGGGLPGGAVVGRAEVMDMIAHRADPEWDATKRIAHPGTFNANPLSAAAGCKALELVATGTPNAQADASAARLREGINTLLMRMEIPGCCYGIASLFHLRLGRPCLCADRSMCTAPHQEIQAGMPPTVALSLKQAMLNAGVDLMGGRMGIVSGAHSEQDVGQTLKAFEDALGAMRREGLV